MVSKSLQRISESVRQCNSLQRGRIGRGCNSVITSAAFSTMGINPHKRITITELENMKHTGKPIAVLTAYDFVTAQAMNDVVDIILVGDSLAMVVLGYDSTLPANLEDMIRHCSAVGRGAARPYIVCDMPFGSYATEEAAVLAAHRLVKEAGALAVKLEGGVHQARKIAAITKEGIPVMAHIGLTPQTSPLHSGYRVQGKHVQAAARLIQDALAVQAAGAFSVVLEKIPSQLAGVISKLLTIPTIGIGAGPHCSGQVLVYNDMVGMYPRLSPKFAKRYVDILPQLRSAFESYAREVKSGEFPAARHHYSMNAADEAALKMYMDNELSNQLTASAPHLQQVSEARAFLRNRAQVQHQHQAVPATSPKLKVAVIGSGAIATTLSARIAAVVGVDSVHMFTRDAARAAQLSKEGATITTAEGGVLRSAVHTHQLADWPAFLQLRDVLLGRPRAHEADNPTMDALSGTFDVVFLANKANFAVSATAAAALLAAPSRSNGIIIPLYNGGYTLEYVRAVLDGSATCGSDSLPMQAHDLPASLRMNDFSSQQVVYGVSYTAAHRHGTEIQEASSGQIMLSCAGSAGLPAALMHVLGGASLRPSLVEDAHALRLSKIFVNAILNPVMAVVGGPNGHFPGMLATNRKLVEDLASELAQLAGPHATALRLIPGFNDFDCSADAIVDRALRVADSTPTNTSSFLADARAGRLSEVGFVNGWVADELKRLHGRIDTVHGRLHNMLAARHSFLSTEILAEDESAQIISVVRKLHKLM